MVRCINPLQLKDYPRGEPSAIEDSQGVRANVVRFQKLFDNKHATPGNLPLQRIVLLFCTCLYFTQSDPTKMSVEPTLLERKLCEAFDVFDNARNGEVDVRDLGTIIRALGCVITEAELQEIQVEVEDVENNCVPLNRFVEYMRKAISERKFRPAEPEDLLKAFQLLDPENRGYIVKDDLEKAIMEVGEPFTKEEVADMMAIACDSETKRINYEHYINLLIVKIPENENVYCIADKIEAARLAAMPKKRRLESLLLSADAT